MSILKSQYLELVSLTQLFILREYSVKDKKMADPLNSVFFPKSSPLLDSSLPAKKEEAPRKQAIPPSKAAVFPDPKIPQPQPAPHPDPTPVPTPPPQPAPPPTQPEPQQPITKSKSVRFFQLEPLMSPASIDVSDFKQLFKEQFPHVAIQESIPADTRAVQLKNQWKLENQIPPIIILSFNNNEKELAFLKNVAQAITRHLAPARVLSAPKIEKEKKWEFLLKLSHLRLIIASDYGLYMLPELMKFYKEFLSCFYPIFLFILKNLN
jgi:hypothetical protein